MLRVERSDLCNRRMLNRLKFHKQHIREIQKNLSLPPSIHILIEKNSEVNYSHTYLGKIYTKYTESIFFQQFSRSSKLNLFRI